VVVAAARRGEAVAMVRVMDVRRDAMVVIVVDVDVGMIVV
jgi:hypothetical protein